MNILVLYLVFPVKGRRQLKPSKPKRMLKMEGKSAAFVACNNGSTAVGTKEGELYMFGKDTHNADSSTGKECVNFQYISPTHKNLIPNS